MTLASTLDRARLNRALRELHHLEARERGSARKARPEAARVVLRGHSLSAAETAVLLDAIGIKPSELGL